MPPKKVSEDRMPRICACGDHGFIQLTKGATAYFSPEDIDRVAKVKWFASYAGGKRSRKVRKAYAARSITVDKRQKTSYLHRELLGLNDPEQLGDHKNGDTLNNRRENLRVTDYVGNGTNNRNPIRRHKADQSLPRGVFRQSAKNKSDKFQVLIRHDGKLHYCGLYACPIEAARVYDKKAREFHGEFATLNNL